MDYLRLSKEDKSKKVGLFKQLKNIEDNLVEVDDNDNKVGIFEIIKDIKNRGIKIDNDDEAVREIRERIKELMDNGVKVNNFNEMKKEIMDHILDLKKQGINVKIDEDQINDLIIKKIYIYISSEIDKFLEKYKDKNISISYNKNKFDTEKITRSLINLRNVVFIFDQFIKDYNEFMDNVKKFEYYKDKKKSVSVSPKQKNMREYVKNLKNVVDLYNPKSGNVTSKKGKGLKILTIKQMRNRLPILLAQIQAGNNSKVLKNELRQIYSLYRSKVLTKTVYNNLIKVI